MDFNADRQAMNFAGGDKEKADKIVRALCDNKPIEKETISYLLGDEEVEKVIDDYHTKLELAEKIYEVMPFFYDETRNWWVWDKYEFKYERKDDIDILNIIRKKSNANTISSKEKNEIIEVMKQFGREITPKEMKGSWIQFRNKIFDIETGNEFDATPEYFATNPIPYELHKEKFVETPKMDEIFEEWVGKDYIKTLYQIIAYSLLPSYPIHRIFCFVGGGMNGKSKFLELLRKFVGNSNCCSTELDSLIQSRFEVSRLHKKLVCQMGETNFNEMSKTSMIKKLSGGDLIGFEYKNKEDRKSVV